MDRSTALWIGAYLDWMEVRDDLVADAEAALLAGEARRAEREQRCEAVLLDALRMQAECVHILKQVIDHGRPAPEALQLALETLRNANDLLDDESRAWHALRAQKRWQLTLSPTSAWENQLDYHWSDALDHVAKDVHALTGRVLAMQEFRA
jgi:hypothetical protein